ncbi:MAG: 1-acyl-sn-glycerol-3-phosphate acyltransferase [Candidatus Rokubacteria bacterium]|nr:1-acyl-sn-glycerol-3-phosphate acyltransferase [Candidatus Rokubacteria bacterium]
MTAPPGEPVNRLYAALRLIARFSIWFFYKAVETRHPERVPARGPVLLCLNHPNNLIDSLLVGTVLPRRVHFLATATLFRHPLMARFLRRCGVIPVYRKQDDPDKMDRNAEMFAACVEALRQGRAIAIYPEGTTHAEARVQRLKTGAARIALAYEAERPDRGERAGELAVIPVGLTFEARKSFRGRVLIAFGPPVPLGPHLEPYRQDPVNAVDALTTRIRWAMETQVIHADRIDLAELVRAVEEMYGSDLVRRLREERGLQPTEIDPLRLSRAIADAVTHFKVHEPERVERLWQRIQGYRALLAEYRVRDQAVEARLARPPAVRRVRASGLAVLGLPLFAYGAAVNALPYLGPRWLSRRLARKETDYATARLLASIVTFPLFWGLETWIVWRYASVLWALLFALSLPLSGLVAYHYLAGLGRLRTQLRFGVLALTHRHAASRLLAERQAIMAELERARQDYVAAAQRTLA